MDNKTALYDPSEPKWSERSGDNCKFKVPTRRRQKTTTEKAEKKRTIGYTVRGRRWRLSFHSYIETILTLEVTFLLNKNLRQIVVNQRPSQFINFQLYV